MDSSPETRVDGQSPKRRDKKDKDRMGYFVRAGMRIQHPDGTIAVRAGHECTDPDMIQAHANVLVQRRI